MAADTTVGVQAGALGGTSMRYHELALQQWLYSNFFVREGSPVPVVFGAPMDAFAIFTRLWGDDKNPFRYLLDLKDEHGTPLYEPFPSPVRYPLLSVYRKGFRYRQYQNFSIHNFRHRNWPTISDTGPAVSGKQQTGTGLTRCDLGNVTVNRRPQAWDYRFQIDHWCMRPDTQAFFVEKLIKQFWRTGGTPQTWIPVDYPGWGEQLIRLFIDGDIENMTPEEPEEGKNVEFRTSFTIVIEGYSVDLDFKIVPALWTLVLADASTVSPQALSGAFRIIDSVNLRAGNNNPTLNLRDNVPANGTDCGLKLDQVSVQEIFLGNPLILAHPPAYYAQPSNSGYPGGTPASTATGTPTVVKT